MRAPWALAAKATCSAPKLWIGIEALAAAFGQEADQVDQHVGVAGGSLDRGRVAQIGLNGVNLADPAERLQVKGQDPAGEPLPGCDNRAWPAPARRGGREIQNRHRR